MSKPSTADIRRTLSTVITPGMTPKQLLKTTLKAHPSAKKKDIIHAAFGAMIELAETEPEKARQLQDFALSNRAPDDSEFVPDHSASADA
jgi:hypothetical protein